MEKEIRKEFQVSDEAVLRYDKAFADRLKAMRDRNGLKRDWVAEQLGVHYNTLKNWELGKSHPGTREILALSRIYHVTLDEFFKGLS
ncbi:MAG: helix-turn-helix transcriptional regulator [Actinobacteria bacterium]|nr:helix-turn-helix transcriptional regulator [Actinomycetota bacterium]